MRYAFLGILMLAILAVILWAAWAGVFSQVKKEGSFESKLATPEVNIPTYHPQTQTASAPTSR